MATLLESYGNCFRKYATFRGPLGAQRVRRIYRR
ncbi:Uncharacterised protein [Raoultella terrigena]|uniref:Uncharacterized protein n=1 Tax=Raoultella terrigena TaxID=577 RepID=A0A3P8M2N4_RAOTE|nr:Uncharacterised protein [Raoultella terrigena]